MNWESKYIKKLMGWCPNTRAYEARQHINFENFESGAPDRTGRENGDLKNSGWLRKTSIQIFLINTFLTLAYLPIIKQFGVNLIFLLAGFLISFFFVIFDWKTQMQRYNALINNQ